jgi:hypothetical protein
MEGGAGGESLPALFLKSWRRKLTVSKKYIRSRLQYIDNDQVRGQIIEALKQPSFLIVADTISKPSLEIVPLDRLVVIPNHYMRLIGDSLDMAIPESAVPGPTAHLVLLVREDINEEDHCLK